MKDFNQQAGNFNLEFDVGAGSVGLPPGFIFSGGDMVGDQLDLFLSAEEVRQLAQMFSAAIAAYDAPERGNGDLSVYEDMEKFLAGAQ